MKTKDVFAFYKTKAAAADAAGVRPQAVTKWGDSPPAECQLRIQKNSHGKLKADIAVVKFYRELVEGII